MNKHMNNLTHKENIIISYFFDSATFTTFTNLLKIGCISNSFFVLFEVHRTEESFLEVFDAEDIVYLTPDSPHGMMWYLLSAIVLNPRLITIPQIGF